MADDHKDYRSLGEILRDAREEADQSIEELSQITKISPKAILAIESDDLDQLAGPIYTRSFVRTLAEAFKLDVEFMLTKLEHASSTLEPPEEDADDDSTWHMENVRVRTVQAEPSRRWLYVSGGAVLVVVVLAVALRGLLGSAPSEPVAEADPVDMTPLLANPNPGPPPGLTEGSRVRTPEPAEATQPAPTEEEEPTPSEPPTNATNTGLAERSTQTRSEPDSPTEPAEQTPDRTVSRDPEPVVEAPVKAEVEAPRGDGLPSIMRPSTGNRAEMKLVVEATGRVDVWAGADGESRERHSLSRGQTIEITARDHFSLLLSDPRAIRVLLDGVPRTPPPGLRGEWILYPDRR